jgi:lysophospholipase L1-like esterase
MTIRTLRVLAAVALLGPGTGFAQSTTPAAPTFTNFFAIGDSLAAGFSSDSLVDAHQMNSVPALIAKQAGVASFQQPLVSEPGIPAELTLVSLSGGGAVILPKSSTFGSPENLNFAGPYNNLAVPGAISLDALQGNPGNPFEGLILRGFGSQVSQAANAHPSFVLVWIGNNDVLGAAIAGEAIDGVTLTPTAAFAQIYAGIIQTLAKTGATIVAANLPDVTTIAFVRTIPPFIVNPATGQPITVNGQPVGLIGPTGPLTSSDYVTLAAAPFLAKGTGIPVALGGNGQPLPDNVILDPNKVAIIQAHVDQDNQAIAQICAGNNVPVVDIHTILGNAVTTGIDVGGVNLTTTFLSGGLTSYDGVHPTDLGNAVLANEWIKVINANGGSLPYVNLGPYLGVGAASTGRKAIPFDFTTQAYEELLRAFPPVGRK